MMMPGRVHPSESDSPPPSDDHQKESAFDQQPRISDQGWVRGRHHRPSMSQDSLASNSKESSYPFSSGRSSPTPNPGTYIVQVPKDQIYRTPPLENALKYEYYARRKHPRNSCCRRCICATLGIFVLLATFIAAAALAFYLVYRPRSPAYAVETLSVGGINFTSTAASSRILRPDFNLTLRAENRNGKIGIYYEDGSYVSVYYNGIMLGEGLVAAFYQPPENVTAVAAYMVGAGIMLSGAERVSLVAEQAAGAVPLELKAEMPVRPKVGPVKSWKVTVKVTCQITLNGLTAKANVVSSACDVDVQPW
ncbi:hypothetical protein Dimus_019599 [Dionaea muscipula]